MVDGTQTVVLSDRHQYSGVRGVLQKHPALEHQCLVKLRCMFLKRLSQHTACRMLQFLAEELDNITNLGLGPIVSYCQAARIVHKTKLPEQTGGSQMHWRVSATANIPRGTGCHKGVCR
jgi:hypothetical protein